MKCGGKVKIAKGVATLDTTASWSGSSATLDGSLTMTAIDIADEVRIIKAPLHFHASSAPLACRLELDQGEIGIAPKGPNPAALGDFKVGFERLAARLNLDTNGGWTTLAGQLDLPPDMFAPAASDKPVMQLTGAKIEVRDKKFELKSACVRLENTKFAGITVKQGTLELQHFVFPWDAGGWWVHTDCNLDLPAGIGALHFEGGFGPHDIRLETDAKALKLGPITVRQVAGNPLLALAMHRDGATDVQFQLAGEIDVPAHTGSGVLPIVVQGAVHFTVAADGTLSIASFSAASDVHEKWQLSGGIALKDFSASIAYDAVKGFSTSIGGGFSLDNADFRAGADLYAALAYDGSNISCKGSIDHVDLTVHDQVHVVDAALGFEFRTRDRYGKLTLDSGDCALIRSDAGDWIFHVSGVHVEITAQKYLDVKVTKGALLLPKQYFDQGGEGQPEVDVGAVPLELRVQGDVLTIGGSLKVKDIGASASGESVDAHATVKNADLEFHARLQKTDRVSADALKAHVSFSHVSGLIHVGLPDGQDIDIGFNDMAWDVGNSLPTGEVELEKDIAIEFGGTSPDCFAIVLRGKTRADGSKAPDGDACSVEVKAQGAYHTFKFSGGIMLRVPLGILQHDAGSGAGSPEVHGEIDGSITLTDDPNGSPQVSIDKISVGGTFRLGGESGLQIRDAELSALNPDQLFVDAPHRDPSRRFALGLSGQIVFQGDTFMLGLQEAKLEFSELSLDALDKLPRFTLKGMEGGLGSKLKELPLQLDEVKFTFKDQTLPLLPLPGLFDPNNIEIGFTLGVKVPFGSDGASAMAKAYGVKATLENGIPRATIDGLLFGIQNLELCGMELSGALYTGGWDKIGQIGFDPIFAGKVGGMVDGIGVDVLVAFQLSKPLGVSLDVEVGVAGIPLGPDGFLLTGASGGVSFANNNMDPGDLGSYIRVPLKSGEKPQQLKPMPDAPKPDFGKQPNKKKLSLPTARPKPTSLPGCPGSCPPDAMNILCQPHPDQEMFPGKAIIKFSSIDESVLQALHMKDWLDKTPPHADPQQTGNTAARQIRQAAQQMIPMDAMPEPLRRETKSALDRTQQFMASEIAKGLQNAGGHTPYEVVRYLAYAGLPCPDMTLQMTGTLSYVGLSAFASITGGFSESTTSAVGVIGSLNVFGMKVGKLRGFFAATNNTGDVDPSICADLTFAVGPLEIGAVNYRLRILGALSDVAATIVIACQQLGEPVVKAAIAQVAKEDLALRDLSEKQLVAVVGRVLEKAAGEIDPASLKA
ncbi:MAG: hypothetical protein ACXWIQ_15840, partial [Caldimonas sp.]